MLFIDADRFELINDSLGHRAGDRVLREIGNRTAACLRQSDLVARFGGDEFVGDGNDTESLMRSADAAMYRAKGKGRNGFSFSPKKAEPAAIERLAFAADLNLAVARAELRLVFQPRVRVADGRIRWVLEAAYSSLSCLKRFPVNVVKLDRSFVRDLPERREGVERVDQLDFLRSEGCHEFQGYLCSAPLPESSVPALLHGSAAAILA